MSGGLVLPAGGPPKNAQDDDTVPNSLCPVMTTTMLLPGALGQGFEVRGVNRPCVRSCMLYRPPDAADKGMGNERGYCMLNTAMRR